ncbi:hypothetical protein QNI19_10965 [Cytophagaceae bacterium DM2B3-1]|uniref:Uncharacterized protein n=1 Tax=Xanthocytophaga flava TaxID=3048013 RepID=A0ABT7CI93_9BACT|nr:hypothetical protein [Xanthocytophaga flavus]MDJ1493453.1 hypothetical protein [Xanthocytophaga flavus]
MKNLLRKYIVGSDVNNGHTIIRQNTFNNITRLRFRNGVVHLVNREEYVYKILPSNNEVKTNPVNTYKYALLNVFIRIDGMNRLYTLIVPHNFSGNEGFKKKGAGSNVRSDLY